MSNYLLPKYNDSNNAPASMTCPLHVNYWHVNSPCHRYACATDSSRTHATLIVLSFIIIVLKVHGRKDKNTRRCPLIRNALQNLWCWQAICSCPYKHTRVSRYATLHVSLMNRSYINSHLGNLQRVHAEVKVVEACLSWSSSLPVCIMVSRLLLVLANISVASSSEGVVTIATCHF